MPPYPQYGYEWMNAATQFGSMMDQLFPVFNEYGLFVKPDQTSPSQPPPSPPPMVMPAITVQPAAAWYEQLPGWAWAVIGVSVGALLFGAFRR